MAFPLISSRLREQAEASAGRPLKTAPRLLALWHLTSLDAPTVAVVWTIAIAWAADIHLDPWIPVLIACGIWTVYVGDRLLDARRAIRSGSLALLRERHHFHWRNRAKLLPLAACTAAIAASLILQLIPVATCEHDSVIAGAAVAYFSGVHSRTKFPAWLRQIASKEFLVGVLFTAGCAAGAYSRLHWKIAGTSMAWPVLASAVFLAALAWLNCAAIENWESGLDSSGIQSHAMLICTTGAIVALVVRFAQPRASALICAAIVSALLLLLLDRKRHRLAPLTLRALADVVLLTPVFLLAFGAHRG